MFKKIVGAAIGAKLAKNSPAVGGATGAALGAAVPFVLSRISLPTMVALGVGGYVAKRWYDKRENGGDKDVKPTMSTRPAPAEATGGAADIINEPPMGAAGGLIADAPGGPDSGKGKSARKDKQSGVPGTPPEAMS